MLVKLQRPPPEIRIFLPARSARSMSATRRPRLAASIAHISPAAPAPIMRASNRWIMRHPNDTVYRWPRWYCAAGTTKDKEASRLGLRTYCYSGLVAKTRAEENLANWLRELVRR